MAQMTVLIASRSAAAAEALKRRLSASSKLAVSIRVMANGHADPLHGVAEAPDLLLLHYVPGQSELLFLAEQGQREQTPLLVCGPGDDPDAMRLAMRAGARDYFAEDVSAEELVASVLRIQEEAARSGAAETGKLIAVVNGKGGSGGSFLATNLAHSLVVDGEQRVTLVDLDLQFAGLCRYLDITPKTGLSHALEAANEMDEISAEAYTSPHASGLRLLAASTELFAQAEDVSLDELEALYDVFLRINDVVVADVPNRFDKVSEYTLRRADRIIVVVQQSLPHIQDAARLLQILDREFSIPAERVQVVVNRFIKNAAIELDDIRKALRQDNLATIPNHYKVVAESINSGIPVADVSKNAAVSKGIRNLQAGFDDQEHIATPGLLRRALPGFLGR